ncbi:hypothetical protein KEM56_003893 [Ascosphaera pollenicola]|nr:hypothetical protein KEM56_003893 [Ascosphaera pollenicola]
MTSNNPRIKHITHLAGFPDPEIGRFLMLRLAHLVYPLMHKYGLKLRRFIEFYPPRTEAGRLLLGQNTNREKIEIRLRSETDSNIFLPRDVVVNTLIHELAHMKGMDHDRVFWDTYCEFWKSYCGFIYMAPEIYSFIWPSNQFARDAITPIAPEDPLHAEMERLEIAPKDEQNHHDKKRELRKRDVDPKREKRDHHRGDAAAKSKAKDICPKCGHKQKSENWYICDACGALAP